MSAECHRDQNKPRHAAHRRNVAKIHGGGLVSQLVIRGIRQIEMNVLGKQVSRGEP